MYLLFSAVNKRSPVVYLKKEIKCNYILHDYIEMKIESLNVLLMCCVLILP